MRQIEGRAGKPTKANGIMISKQILKKQHSGSENRHRYARTYSHVQNLQVEVISMRLLLRCSGYEVTVKSDSSEAFFT